ncbi:DUF2813 domain-containing protein [Mesorhizobium sp.]|uniref:ATP-dependent nuclease n=1 Tax=Mesorhizobium sp. TaxID=1871066 RepID=UPI000FE9C569|nr:DUF2813 domain-containing protein [Mesorhizobium sp.]RWP12610.1 MAG: DUF2813 domain-containing protein [Mesorhizobium sp.]
MEITHVRIRNFRSIRTLDLPLDKITVLVGPNNAGKSAILDALRIALGRRWGQKGTGFTEYDIHLGNDSVDPKKAGPAVIEVEFGERVAGEWQQEIQDDLLNEMQTDAENRARVTLRVSCGWDANAQAYEPLWEFLDAAGQPIKGGRRITNTHPLFNYVPIFYMNALRDPIDEFSVQSQLWGRLLRAISIPEALEARTMRVLELVNTRLMEGDPRLKQIATEMRVLTSVAAQDSAGDLQLRAVPLKAWDLISRAEVILRSQENSPWLPLRRHGQGVQSLSVIFLFETFISQLLKELYGAGSSPILALEEPEAHLHPQAARTIWRHIEQLPGQKIVTTHSPYLLQNAPFRSIRLVRSGSHGTEVSGLWKSYVAKIPNDPGLAAVVQKYPNLGYSQASRQLEVSGKMADQCKKDLMAVYGQHNERIQACQAIAECKKESNDFVADDTLSSLDEWARRIRGEIFFARKWLLVEGQSEVIFIQGLARAMGYDLDRHGVAVIDYRNNGSLGPFAELARAFSIPWLALIDNDLQGKSSVKELDQRNFETAEISDRVFALTGKDFEAALLASKNEQLLRNILQNECSDGAAANAPIADLHGHLGRHKVRLAAALVGRMGEQIPMSIITPEPINDMILKLGKLT